MNPTSEWREIWEERSAKAVSDYEFDRGTSPRNQEVEELSRRELLEFVDPQPHEIVFDAGCGTGANIFLLHSRTAKIIGMDCTAGAIARCERRIEGEGIANIELFRGDVTKLPLADSTVDKILCMSVFQYLSDSEVRIALREFARILKRQGVVILHVKNASSFYLSTLLLAKKLKRFLRRATKLEYFRSFSWYQRELKSAGFGVLEYNSFNILMIEGMPGKWLRYLQKLELRFHKRFPLNLALLRRRGSELKLKARVKRP
jgi:ubiquinone/menaquinone biosynthesis C-methylase UbiE